MNKKTDKPSPIAEMILRFFEEHPEARPDDPRIHLAINVALAHGMEHGQATFKAINPTSPPSSPSCGKCNGPHVFDTSVESDQWNAVIRAAGLSDYLCLSCILEVFAKAGKPFDAHLYGDNFHGDELRFTPVQKDASAMGAEQAGQ